MAKYRFEFKKKVVMEYLQAKGGLAYLSKKHGISSTGNKTMLLKWVNACKEFGDDGLRNSRKNDIYSFEFKIHVVELYLSTEVSYEELALTLGMNNPPLIATWVNDFRIAGLDALRPKKKGRKKSLESENNKEKIVPSPENASVDPSAEQVKQLEDELLTLRIENAYLFPKATYRYWQKRFDRENPDTELEEIITGIRKENKDFGYRRIYGELRKRGRIVNKKKVQRIIQKLGLQVTSFTRKSRKYSSYKGKIGRIAPNRIHRRFHTCIPHQKITTGTTEFKYYEVDDKGRMTIQKLYFDPFMDMFHSDCGWAYQRKAYRNSIKSNRIYQSMSRKGNCYDNSIMENFFGIMNQEMYYGCVYYSYEELKDAIENYIY